jgi:hypothetical protein
LEITIDLRYRVLVERKGFAFFVELEYENLPDFCSYCNIIGHHVENCKKLIALEDGKHDKVGKDKKLPAKNTRKVFVPTRDGRIKTEKTNTMVADKGNDVVQIEEQPGDIILNSPKVPKVGQVQNSLSGLNRFAALQDEGVCHNEHSDTDGIENDNAEFVDESQLEDTAASSTMDAGATSVTSPN